MFANYIFFAFGSTGIIVKLLIIMAYYINVVGRVINTVQLLNGFEIMLTMLYTLNISGSESYYTNVAFLSWFRNAF